MAENMSANLATRSMEVRIGDALGGAVIFRYYWKYEILPNIKRSRTLHGVFRSKTGPTQTWVTADGGVWRALF